MTGKVELITESDIPRFTQLINKSNQFNLRTQRYSQSEIEKMFSDQQYILLKAELEDVFTRYGIISCVILEKRENVCFIDTWLMSCRVLKRDVEKMMMNGIYEYAKKEGCTEIRGEYIPTKKNAMVRNLLSDMGFEKYQSVDDNEFYALSINNYKEKNIYIERRN
jgi:FkbH-like protein